MTLFDEHKSERRHRIQRAARKLVAERGYDGLTMRDLARAARVSVPTLYNLFGSKDAILVAELETLTASVAALFVHPGTVAGSPTGTMPASASFFARGQAAFDAGQRLIEESPEFFRAVTQMFLTSPESGPMRRRADEAFIAIMRANLAGAKAAGQLAEWADPDTVARHGLMLYNANFLRWAIGEIDIVEFRAIGTSAMCHLLAGVARGAYAADIEATLRSLPPLVVTPKEIADVRSRD